MIRRRDRIQRYVEPVALDDRASVVTSATEEPINSSIKTLQAQQVEVVEVDKHSLEDRVVEFVSMSIVVRSINRSGSAGPVVTCIVGGGPLSLFRFTDTDFFAVSDNNVLMLLCSPKLVSPDEFQNLVERTLSIKCCTVPKLMSVIQLDPIVMSKIWASCDSISARRLASSKEVRLEAPHPDPLITEAELDLVDDSRVSTAHSHLLAAVDDLVRSILENRPAQTIVASSKHVKATLAQHSTSGRLAGGISLVHTIEALSNCLAVCDSTVVAPVQEEVSRCIVSAGSTLAWESMAMVTTAEKAESIAANIVNIAIRETLRTDIAFAVCSAGSLLSCANEDLVVKTILSSTRDNDAVSRVEKLVENAALAMRLLVDSECRDLDTIPSRVAAQLLALVGEAIPEMSDERTELDRGAVEAIWTGCAVILSTAEKFLDAFIVEVSLQTPLIRLVTLSVDLAKNMCLVLATAEVRGTCNTLSLLQRWLTMFTSLFRRSSMWCAMLQVRQNADLNRNFLESATVFMLTKALIAPFDGTSNSKLGLIAHQWLVKLSIAAGPAAHDVVVATFDIFYRYVLAKHSEKRKILWSEVTTAIEGLVSSIPSPSPMLRMWESVTNVIAAYQRYSTDSHDPRAQQVIVSQVARVAQRQALAVSDDGEIPSAESYLRDYPWHGRAEKFDVSNPTVVSMSILDMAKRTGDAHHSLARFGVSATDLGCIGAPFAYVWNSLKADRTEGRERALALQCLSFSDMLRTSGAPAAPAAFLAACGVAKLADMDLRLKEEGTAVTQIVRTFSSQIAKWLDLQLALHLASVPEGFSASTTYTSERNQETDGSTGRHLPQALRLGPQLKTQGKTSVIDRIALAYT